MSMAVSVMLSVDLNNVTSAARTKFYDELKGRKWVKLKLTTTWRGRFTEVTSKAGAINTAKSDVAAAAKAAGVANYEAAANASDEPPTEWTS